MKLPSRLALLLPLVACKDDGDPIIPTDDTSDTWIPWPDDTGEEGDEDGDGYTVEEGDCDDTNPRVNPGRTEEEDGVDNDCDGRVDEAFRGLVVLQENDYQEGIPGRVVGVDDFGEQEWEVVLDNADFWLHMLSPAVDDGFIVGTWADGRRDQKYPDSFTALHHVDPQGTMTVLADFSDAELYPLGLYGLATHPDGYYVAATGDAVYAVEPDTGSVTQLAAWDWETEIAPFALGVDELTGEIGVYGFFGGFATIDEVGGATLHHAGNAESPEILLYSGQHRDLGGWYAIASRGGPDWLVVRYSFQDEDWVTRATFTESWTPNYMTIDSVNGGYYLSSGDATYPVVWRIPDDGGDASRFFLSPYENARMDLQGLYTVY